MQHFSDCKFPLEINNTGGNICLPWEQNERKKKKRMLYVLQKNVNENL